MIKFLHEKRSCALSKSLVHGSFLLYSKLHPIKQKPSGGCQRIFYFKKLAFTMDLWQNKDTVAFGCQYKMIVKGYTVDKLRIRVLQAEGES